MDVYKPLYSERKKPRQARSEALVAAVLEAAVRVLAEEGAARFTTARVAERAGISVGSLYQYFPNKAAILYRLQSDEWRETSAQWSDILRDGTMGPRERVRMLVHVFLRSECEEAAVRGALAAAMPLYRDRLEDGGGAAASDGSMEALVREVAPSASVAVCALAADVIETTLSELGQVFSDVARTEAEIMAYAEALGDMFCAYLDRLAGPEALKSGGA